jgi:hypothetical protein
MIPLALTLKRRAPDHETHAVTVAQRSLASLGLTPNGLQALLLYLPFDGLVSLYVISGLFGLSQGGIVPSYALIIRQYFPAREAGGRIGLVLLSTVLGMALGGWMSGEIYDLTGSCPAACRTGIAWNLLNMSIAFWLLMSRRKTKTSAA